MDQTSESTKVFQKQKYDEIIELLLSAGYFRARINTLSEFDKVVGGLCWCITSSGENVDVDILFQENSTIGQRITLSEAIVKALRKMNCPAQIQPHQIQGGVGGSDFNALYPVIVWLVKKFFERRELREQQLRAFSVLQFSKNYQFPSECDKFTVSDSLNDILKRNKAIRQYKRRAGKKESEETRVHACLMEYGEVFGYHSSSSSSTSSGKAAGGGGDSSIASDMIAIESSEAAGKMVIKLVVQDAADIKLGDEGTGGGGGAVAGGRGGAAGGGTANAFDKRLAQAQKDAEKEDAMFAAAAARIEAEMKGGGEGGEGGAMGAAAVGADGENVVVVSGSMVSAMVGLGSSEISSAAAAYEADAAAQGQGGSKAARAAGGAAKLGPAALFKRQKQALLKQQQEQELQGLELDTEVAEVMARLSTLEEERANAAEYTNKLREMMLQQEELEKQAKQQKELVVLRDLVGLNESYKAQEAAFKASCKAQMSDLNARIKELEDSSQGADGDEEAKKLREIEDMHGKVLDKYNRLRQMLAAANLEVAATSRIIDDIPTRTELIQYERRFVELYQQISWKLEETRKYYALYNTLETTLSFLQKEVKLLNAISENFDAAMLSPQSKAEYLQQISGIVRGVEESLKKQESLASQKEVKLDQLKASHQNLVDEQRRYFKAVKDFQEECTKNEWLTQKLEEITGTTADAQ